ncbi:DUF6352 family protein [Actimicrobium antarcticum]|uniref:DUF6352 family protein n=1 Tax=Actimicrobium antarcticum TaxID=1051899 RepID=A0ABP7TQ66_9BURK
MHDFWTHSGFNLTQRQTDGQLLVSDALLRAWWSRPEVAPVPESCSAELALHDALLATPRRPVSAQELAALQDPDARDNYGVMLAFRDRLLTAPTLEAAYLDIFRNGSVTVPPLFIDQLAQMIVRGILDGSDDALLARTAELFFRPQKVALEDGRIMLADAATVELHESGSNYGDLGRLLVESKTKPRRVDLDVLSDDNADRYWQRDEAHDTVLAFQQDSLALARFCRLIALWVRHFYSVDVVVEPVAKINDPHWAWHIGLDAQASAILNDLYKGKTLDADRNRRILSLFTMTFADPSVVRPDVAGRPVYLACAMTEQDLLRIKPQNLLLNLPLASIS